MARNPSDGLWIGPHEGRELELMARGEKPLAMFVEPIPCDCSTFPEKEFDVLVASGALKKVVVTETSRLPDGREGRLRRVLYSLPAEEWRIEAILLVQGLYHSFGSAWRPDLDRTIGLLLGYERDDIEYFVATIAPR